MGVQKIVALIIILLVTLTGSFAFPTTPGEMEDGLAVSACAIQTSQGLLPDHDCDGRDDYHDNCKYVPNSDQRDANRNGIGDACDLLITRIDLEPGTEVKQGTFFSVKIELLNNKPYEIRDVQVRARQLDLKLDVSTLVESLKPGEHHVVELVLKAPGCATPGKYELTFTTDHKEGGKRYTQTKYQRIIIKKVPGACKPAATAIDNTILETITQQNAEVGESVIYPITITNLNGEAKTYHLSLQDINHIGTYRIEPTATVTIPAGGKKTVYLTISTERFAPVGRNEIQLFLETEGKEEKTTLHLRLIKPAGGSLKQALTTALQLGLILIVIGLIIAAGIIAYKKLNEDEEREGEGEKGVEQVAEDEEFESYY